MSTASAAQRCALVLTAAWLLGLAFTDSGLAQFPAREGGTLEGHVRGEGGKPLAGATVELAGQISRKATTDRRGRFVFGALQPGAYSVEVRLAGHVTSVLDGIRLHSREVLYLPFSLQPGQESSFTMTAKPAFDTATPSSVWRLGLAVLGPLPSAGTLGPLLSLRPWPAPFGLFDGASSEGAEWWSDLPVVFVDELSVRPADVSAELDFARGSPVHLVTRAYRGAGHAALRGRLAPAALEGSDRTGLRGIATAGSPFGTRTHGFVGLARSRHEAAEGVLQPDREADFVLAKAAFSVNDSWRVEGSFLSFRGAQPDGRDRLAKVLATGLPTPALELEARADWRARSSPSLIAENSLSGEAETLSAWLAVRLGAHSLSTGASLRSLRSLGGSERSEGSWPDGRSDGDGSVVWVEDRLRWANLSFGLGLRSVRSPSSALRQPATQRSGRVSLGWDLYGNGRWNLYLNGGEFHGLKSSAPLARPIGDGGAQITRYALGIRHQLLPGVVLEAEGLRALPRVSKQLASVEPLTVRALCSPEESRARAAVSVSLFYRWDAALDYQRSSLRDAGCSDLGPSSESLQSIRLRSTWRGERGWHSGVVVRFDDGMVKSVPGRSTPDGELSWSGLRRNGDASLFQLDISFGYSWSLLPSFRTDGMLLGARIDALNLFNAATPISLHPAGDPFAHDLNDLGFQRPRRIWFGFSLEI